MPDESSSPSSRARSERLPPYSDEAEQGVLGSILQDAKILDLCVENQLAPDSFYVPAHRAIFQCLLDMTQSGRPIDVLTVADRLRDSNKIDFIGGEVFLHRLIDSTPTPSHAGYFIDIVHQKHLLRQVIECARKAETECYSSDIEATALLGQVEQSFFDITDKHRSQLVPWPETVKGVMQQIEEIDGSNQGGVKTGFIDMDRTLTGLRPGNMIILAARPSMGKTSLAINMAENVARAVMAGGERIAVGMFSLEMSRDDLVLRMLCTHAEVSMHRIRSGGLSSKGDDHRKLVTAADAISKEQIYLDDSAGLDVVELRARARRMKQKYDVRLIIVDYLQLLHSKEHSRQGRQLETSAISGSLKAMAKELGVPVLVLSQLSRAPESREAGVPKLSDLRDSGSIEQDADVVLLLRRPCRYHEDAEYEDRRLAIVDVAKNRNGPTKDNIRLNFEEEFTRFEDRVEDRGVDGFGEEADEMMMGEGE